MRKDQLSIVTGVDEAATAILGWSADELVGRRTLDLIHPDDKERAIANFMDMLGRPGHASRVRLRHQHRDGSWLWLEVTNHNHLTDPDDPHVLAEMVDVNGEVAALQSLRANEHMMRRLTEALPVGVLNIGVDRTVSYANARLGSIVGVGDATTVDEQFACIVDEDRETLMQAVDAALTGARDCDIEASFRLPQSKVRRCVISLRALTSDATTVTGAVACLVDITEDVNLREELEQRVRYDPLTGTLNHASTLAELQLWLDEPREHLWTVAVFIDLDEFKETNDRFGHVAGDRMLKHVATRLRQMAGDDGLVGRLGGDEFLVVVHTADNQRAVTGAAGRVAAAVDNPLLIGHEWTTPKASIGLAYVADREPLDADVLIAAADGAMYESKRRGDGTPVISRPALG